MRATRPTRVARIGMGNYFAVVTRFLCDPCLTVTLAIGPAPKLRRALSRFLHHMGLDLRGKVVHLVGVGLYLRREPLQVVPALSGCGLTGPFHAPSGEGLYLTPRRPPACCEGLRMAPSRRGWRGDVAMLAGRCAMRLDAAGWAGV